MEDPGTVEPGTGLQVVRAVDVDALATALGQRLAAAPADDPFAAIEIAVPSLGMARWLSQRLSHHLGTLPGEGGVTAGIDLPFLGQIVARTLAATLDPDQHPDPWMPDQLQWSVLEHLDTLTDEPVNAPLVAHLTEGGSRADRRRLPLARRIADLFDRYALYRPHMVARWREGAAVDAADRPLPDRLRWQPALWQQLCARLDRPSPDQRLAAAVSALRAAPDEATRLARPDQLPGPVTVFGVLGMPAGHLELLAALAARTRVALYVIAPVPAWRVPSAATARGRPTHPLLAASGTAAWLAGNALDALLASVPAEHTVLGPARAGVPAPAAAVVAGAAGGTPRLLAALQEDLRADRRRGREGAPAPVPLDPADTSIGIHACHGPLRQLEVLREVLLGRLEDDPTLEPRDIVVLTPDIATYAPLVAAAFPPGPEAAPGAPPTLPVRVADRTVRPGNHVAEALERLLALVTARVGASEVLDLLGMPPVRARFSLGVEDLATLTEWVRGTGISWGVDGAHRRALIDLDDDAHTWSAGLDRLALGAAMPDDGIGTVGAVVPFDDVEGDRVAQLGRVLAATDALFATLGDLADPRPRAAWLAALHAALGTLCDPGEGLRRDPGLTEELATVRDDLATLLGPGATPTEDEGPSLTLEEVRWLLAGGLGTGGGSTPYGTGAVTVSGLVPLRNLPHRVVCLVGMDDGALPRTPQEHGFDLLAADPRPGDPDTRLEDRQLFLDALLAAGDHLVITYGGHDPRTNEVIQPAVPVSELLDVLEETALPPASGATVRDQVLVDHPLQPHSARYFRPVEPAGLAGPAGQAGGRPPQAFDPGHLAAARAARGERHPAPGFVARPLPAPGTEVVDPRGVELGGVVEGIQHPVRTLLRRRLGLSLGEDDRRVEDRDPTELDGLQRWRISEELLAQRLEGRAPRAWQQRQLATGTVPVGGLGAVALAGVEERVEVVTAAFGAQPGPDRVVPIDLAVELPPGPGIAGWTPDGGLRLTGSVHLRGQRIVTVQMSSIKAKHRLAAWVRLLAVAAARPELAVDALLIGPPAGDDGQATTCQLDPALLCEVDTPSVAEVARSHLGVLLRLYLRAHVQAVPMLPETARALAVATRQGRDDPAGSHPVRAAWEGRPGGRGRPRVPGDRDDAYLVQALGAEVELDALLAAHPGLVGDIAAVWEPILAAEVDP